MNRISERVPVCQVVQSVEPYQGKQGPMYARGVSADTVGADAIWLGTIRMPPGSRTKAHLHVAHETALYVLHGECELWSGASLQCHAMARAGDYLYIPAGVPHVAVNRSQTEPFIVVGARTDPHEQEGVELRPDLDARVPESVS